MVNFDSSVVDSSKVQTRSKLVSRGLQHTADYR